MPGHGRRVAKMARVVALIEDLFFQMKLAETARHLGAEVKVATTPEALLEEARKTPSLVIVDLNARCGGVEAVKRLRASGSTARVVGFLSHVQTELAARGRSAGCDEVMPRSAFTANLAEILSGAKG